MIAKVLVRNGETSRGNITNLDRAIRQEVVYLSLLGAAVVHSAHRERGSREQEKGG